LAHKNHPLVEGLRRPERSEGRRSPSTKGWRWFILSCEKKQLAKRLAGPFLQLILQQFNDGLIDRAEAAHHLQISQAHLYRLRTRWLQNRAAFTPQLSGGGHWPAWPPEATQFLKDFVPLQKPPNFQLVADELARRFDFTRHRQSVAAFVRTHFPQLIGQPQPRLKARRRWERARLGELWQHDSSIHQWWPADDKQTLLLTVDDHSRKLLGAVFVPTDTTWHHFEHFRRLFLQHALPLVVYTDGLSLFGHDSMADDRDPCSEFQRAFSALGVTHLVAPSPQAKGKIERRFGTLQLRLVALLAYEQVTDYPAAQIVLDRQVAQQNATVCRTTGLSPNAAWDKALAEQRTAIRPCPPATLLNLHLALHLRRRVNADHQIDFLGRSWAIAPTQRATITLIHHPLRRFWAVAQPPSPPLNAWPEILGDFTL